MYDEPRPDRTLSWLLVVGTLLVFVGVLLLLSSGVDIDCHSTLRQLSVYWCLIVYFVLSFAFCSIISQFHVRSLFMKGVTYTSAPLSLLLLIVAGSGEEHCKIDWGIVTSLTSSLLLFSYWYALRYRLGLF